MKNTFTGARLEFPNKGIHALIAETMTFRKQLTARVPTGEFRSQSGWYDALNGLMISGLEALCKTVKRIAYSVPSSDPAALREAALTDAKDTAKTLKDAYDGKSINSDNLVMPALPAASALTYDWSGAAADYPQPTPEFLPNDWARMFVAGLDTFVVAATNLDSAWQPSTINAYEAAQLLAMLNELFSITQVKGGEANKVDIPTGVMASEKPATFNADGKFDPGAK